MSSGFRPSLGVPPFGSIEMLREWFNPQDQGDVNNDDLVEEMRRQESAADALLVGREASEALVDTGAICLPTRPESPTTSTAWTSTSSPRRLPSPIGTTLRCSMGTRSTGSAR